MGIFTKAIITAEQITDYIPQRAPIVMVDAFFGVHQGESFSALTITNSNIFCEDNKLSDCGIIEHIAQSAALRVGYLCKNEGKEIPLGFIGAVNKLKIHHLPSVGETMHTKITIEHEIMNVTLISATVAVDETIIAECKMKIYLMNDENQ